MKDAISLSHTKWDCKYHVVFIPKYRRKAIYQGLRQYLGDIFHELAGGKQAPGYRAAQKVLKHLLTLAHRSRTSRL